ncbi:hypothetical protein GGTG_13710 [Gaeumannomyces tritici R3-111a-1]|uniref:Sulfatase N-terminal domain-containing protein n=1 Tax=Gaeumannomyces tritici (strain R3-111a-1) TaxID=644352 RepID=J3PJM3_GAET3|nr:hypothetical protein GGTG_13710 [Gaeumannomyces tritici R3-111a-1]EJT68723.1 hypothetical protein GGTG_13710 [Gaeumannomyces tritici R3-111a-1]
MIPHRLSRPLFPLARSFRSDRKSQALPWLLRQRLVQGAMLVLSLQSLPVAARPNIVLIMSDDQDARLGSMRFMETVQSELVAKGSSFAAHNTNATNVFAPGSGQVSNGVNLLNWASPPKGWDHVDDLLEPYQTTPNSVFMAEYGSTPVFFKGYHQADVTRAKALDRLEQLTAQSDPFFLFISPTALYLDDSTEITVPCTCHEKLFTNATVPRTPSFSPPDNVQRNQVWWIRELSRMGDAEMDWADAEYRRRAQALAGVDKLVSDVLGKLEEKGALDNTYSKRRHSFAVPLPSSNHRMAVGKTTPFTEDTNLPFVVRGPGVPQGVESTLVGSRLDLAPTFLDIAGVPKGELPSLLDSHWCETSDVELYKTIVDFRNTWPGTSTT